MKRKEPCAGVAGAMAGARDRGFTLVELLVTVAIILVLAALAFLGTAKIRASARQAHALSALRQIGSAHLAYAADNNGAINTLRDSGEVGSGYEGGPNAWVSNSFWGRMQPYLFAGIETNDQKALNREIKAALALLFNTTDLKSMAGTPFAGISAYADSSGISVPLGFNLKVKPAWRAAPLRLGAVGENSRFIYCTYGRYFVDKSHGAAYTPLPKPGEKGRAIYYLPNKKALLCFLDGRVEMIAPPIPERAFE